MSQVASLRNTNSILSRLRDMKEHGGAALTTGLSDEQILGFLEEGRGIVRAVERAYDRFCALKETHPEFLALGESEQIARAHEGLTNFYSADAVNPYIALGAAGPWVVTAKGAVVYDCGGYGMLGLGHAPKAVLDAMNQTHVMANVMTASVQKVDFVNALRKEIGHTRKDGIPFESFLCLNSGSELMSVAARITDIHTKHLTDPGGRYEGRKVCGLTLKGSFHGRTDRPAHFSDSTIGRYREQLASFANDDYLLTIEPNSIDELEAVYAAADESNVFIEAFFMEPVMGEGNPGMAITTEFYQRARELTREHDSFFVVDSIQAGLRAHGVLSVVDYPGFQELDEPDMESYSKALNAGQVPLSVLVMSKKAADTYQRGLYGNTMTTNPRSLDVAMAVLESLTPELRENIRTRGKQLVERLGALGAQTDGAVTSAQGTGLLVSCELDDRYKIFGANSTEDYLRRIGLAVIHGGAHSLRYTPVFDISEKEVDLIVGLTREALLEGPRAQ